MASSKRRKIESSDKANDFTTLVHNCNKWKTDTQQRTYSTKLVEALRQVRLNNSNNNNASPGVREVRAAADKALATAAKGRTRWSRAILNRLRVTRLRKVKRTKMLKEAKLKKKKNVGKKLPAMESKVKMLGKLVPGCKGIPTTCLLEEVGDYISALEMQVRAMAALTELLGGGGQPAPNGGLPTTRS